MPPGHPATRHPVPRTRLMVIDLRSGCGIISPMASARSRRKQNSGSTLRLIDDVETLARYCFWLDGRFNDKIAKWRRSLQSGAVSTREARDQIEPILAKLINESGATADLGELRAELLKVPPESSGVFLQAWDHKRRFPRLYSVSEKLPPYALIFVRARGFYERQARPEVWTAESAMYEDMAMAVNHLLTQTRPEEHKCEAWLVRSIVGSAYYFVESYLNGIAVEALLSKWDALTPSERGLLAERKADGSTKYVKFKDKLLKYPRVASGARYPELTDQDEDVRLFLTDFRDIRDAIVHPSHHYEFTEDRFIPAKVEQLLGLHSNSSAALRCCDASITLVRKLCKSAGRDQSSLRWLYDRSVETGLFPPAAFE